MASMFSGLSSAIGKKLLLFGLRHIDILDKDPQEFVNVDLGKKIMAESGLPIVSADDLGDAAKKIVAEVKKAA